MKVSKSMMLFSGSGAIFELGNGGCWCCGCCFFAAARFFVDDGMVAENIAIKNSCGCVVESENARDDMQN